MSLTDAAVIVVTWRTPEMTSRLIAHLARIYPGVHLVIVECGPSGLVEKAHPRLTVLPVRNLGYAGGNNLGIRYALESGSALVCVLNSDAFPLPGSLEAMADAARVGGCAVGAMLVRWTAQGAEVNAGTAFDWTTGLTCPASAAVKRPSSFFPCGAALMASAETWRSVGAFDSNLFLFYEEVDWAERARDRGVEMRVARQARVLHLGSKSVALAPRAAAYLHSRNRAWMLRRYGGRHGARISPSFELCLLARSVGSCIRRRAWRTVIPGIRGAAAGLFGRVPPVTEDPVAALRNQAYETRD